MTCKSRAAGRPGAGAGAVDKRRRRFGWKTLLAGALAMTAVGAIVGVGEVLSAPARAVIGAAPADLHAIDVAIPTQDAAVQVQGWLVRNQPGHGAVLLLHGVRGNRIDMLGRARFLARAGYTVLLGDLPAHGASGGIA